ncbi:MAG TPA: tetratricopeptide repeat protein [Methylomirabilota bacterium]|nr:tetratricopeptide repeat protein [Methylomirabilota bacterium]
MPADDVALAATIRRQEERLAKDPTSLAFAQLADLYRKAGRPADAIATCRSGLQRYPHYTTARLILAKTLLTENDPAAALAEIEAILQVSPKDVQCHRLAAEAHRRMGRVDAAVQSLESAVAVDPGDRESRALLTVLRADASVGEAAGVARLLADDTFVTPAFGALCLEQGLAEEAAMVFTRLLRQDPENTDTRERLELALRARSRRKG